MVPVSVTERISLTSRTPAGDTGWRGECGARGRRLVTAAPGRLGHHACRHYDRRARCIAVAGTGAGGGDPPLIGAKSREAWPELSLRDARVPLARAAVERRKACCPRRGGAAPQGAEDDAQRLSAFRFLVLFVARMERSVIRA